MSTQIMNKPKKAEIKDLVIIAAKKLLEVCDGAHSRDGQGFNGYHAKIVRDMLQRPYMSDKMIAAIQKMLHTYKNSQLPDMIGDDNVKSLFTKDYNDFLTVKAHESAKNYMVKFGKHKGKTYYDVASTDPGYLQWMTTNEKYKESATLAKLTLEGKELVYRKVYPKSTIPLKTTAIKKSEQVSESVQVTADPEDNNKIQITFSFSKEIVAKIKELPIPDRRWNKERPNKSWTISPLAWDTLKGKIEAAEPRFKINISKEAQTVLDNTNKRVTLSDKSETSDDYKIEGLKGELMNFQKVGVQFLELANGRALIADQMGLGKTIQALAYLQLTKPEKVLIIVPASLKINWEREAFKWLSYTNKIKRIKNGKIVDISEDRIIIINYDVIKKWKESLLEYSPEVVIFDESHYIKNQKAQRSQTAQEIGSKVPKVILLTGTPVLNRPKELYQQLRLIDSTTYHEKGFFRYAKRYCNAHEIHVGKNTFWNFDGASNTKELNEKLRNVMIRRTKDKVLTELPDKTKTTIYLQSMNPELRAVNKEYVEYKNNQQRKKQLWNAYINAESRDEKAAIMQAYHEIPKYPEGYLFSLIERMKQAAVKAKLKDAIQWIEDFIANEEKIVVFTTHNHTVDTIMNHFGSTAVKLTGSDNTNARQKSIDEFQNNPEVKVFVGNLKAAGVGITLTAASSVAFIELGWTPGEHIQAEDRVHRIGQKAAVNIYYLVNEKSIEPTIAKTLLKKSIIVDKITDGHTEQSLNILQEVMKEEGIEKTEEEENE